MFVHYLNYPYRTTEYTTKILLQNPFRKTTPVLHPLALNRQIDPKSLQINNKEKHHRRCQQLDQVRSVWSVKCLSNR